jgi:hypothetical protein
MELGLQLNLPQQIFTLFYAITWGTAANSQPRWRAFAWGAIFMDAPARRRAVLSTVILNVLPSIYFVFVLWSMSTRGWADLSKWDFNALWKTFMAIIPALAPFGFYRVWTGCVASLRGYFYGIPKGWKSGDDKPQTWSKIGLDLNIDSELNREFALGNLLFGNIYILLGLLVAAVVRCA